MKNTISALFQTEHNSWESFQKRVTSAKLFCKAQNTPLRSGNLALSANQLIQMNGWVLKEVENQKSTHGKWLGEKNSVSW